MSHSGCIQVGARHPHSSVSKGWRCAVRVGLHAALSPVERAQENLHGILTLLVRRSPDDAVGVEVQGPSGEMRAQKFQGFGDFRIGAGGI